MRAFQAAAAQPPDVRAAFVRIALEEAEHAELSRDVAAWLEQRLEPAERARVGAARARATIDLRRELEREPPERWSSELGLPTREQALAAFSMRSRARVCSPREPWDRVAVACGVTPRHTPGSGV